MHFTKRKCFIPRMNFVLFQFFVVIVVLGSNSSNRLLVEVKWSVTSVLLQPSWPKTVVCSELLSTQEVIFRISFYAVCIYIYIYIYCVLYIHSIKVLLFTLFIIIK